MLALKRVLAYQIDERWLSRETIFLPIRIANDVCNFMREKKKSGNGTLTMTAAGIVVWLGFANEDQEGCCPRRLEASSWLMRPMRDRQVLVQCRSGLGFWWWKQLELSSSVVCFWGSLSGSLRTVKQPCGLCRARRLCEGPCQTTAGSLCVTHWETSWGSLCSVS